MTDTEIYSNSSKDKENGEEGMGMMIEGFSLTTVYESITKSLNVALGFLLATFVIWVVSQKSTPSLELKVENNGKSISVPCHGINCEFLRLRVYLKENWLTRRRKGNIAEDVEVKIIENDLGIPPPIGLHWAEQYEYHPPNKSCDTLKDAIEHLKQYHSKIGKINIATEEPIDIIVKGSVKSDEVSNLFPYYKSREKFFVATYRYDDITGKVGEMREAEIRLVVSSRNCGKIYRTIKVKLDPLCIFEIS